MTQIKDMPVLGTVPPGGYIIVSQPTVPDPNKSVFAKIPALANAADYVIGVTQPGTTGAAQKLLVHKLPHAITFPASLAGSYMTALTAATASTVFTLAYKRGGTTTTIGVFTFAAGGTDATISGVVIPTLAAADIVLLSGPATADATLADIGCSFLASKQ